MAHAGLRTVTRVALAQHAAAASRIPTCCLTTPACAPQAALGGCARRFGSLRALPVFEDGRDRTARGGDAAGLDRAGVLAAVTTSTPPVESNRQSRPRHAIRISPGQMNPVRLRDIVRATASGRTRAAIRTRPARKQTRREISWRACTTRHRALGRAVRSKGAELTIGDGRSGLRALNRLADYGYGLARPAITVKRPRWSCRVQATSAGGSTASPTFRCDVDRLRATLGAPSGSLTRAPAAIQSRRRPDGPGNRESRRGGKSGLQGQTDADNVRRAPGKCHKKQPPTTRKAGRKVKCRKSAPRCRQRSGTANPTGSKTE